MKRLKRRRGSLLVVILYGTLMAIVMLGMMQLASGLYSTSRDSAKMYSDIQTYRSATELACYQYISDLEAVTRRKNLDTEWLSLGENAMYTQACEEIQEAIGKPLNPGVPDGEKDPNTWAVESIVTALSAINISDPSILTNMVAKLTGVREELHVTIPEIIEVDWDSPNSWRRSSGAYGELRPIIVEVALEVKGESLFEKFKVTGLFLRIQRNDSPEGEMATMFVEEKDEGVEIVRVSG